MEWVSNNSAELTAVIEFLQRAVDGGAETECADDGARPAAFALPGSIFCVPLGKCMKGFPTCALCAVHCAPCVSCFSLGLFLR